MEKLQSYEQYSQVLAAFKGGRTRCGTNKLMTREELTTFIDAGKLYYEQTGDTLWFFVNEGYFYSASFYVPADAAIEMRRRDMDVRTELMGNPSRYNKQWERELVTAGFEKYDLHWEYVNDLALIIGDIQRYIDKHYPEWKERGFSWHRAVKKDYPQLWDLWMKRFGKDLYTITPMSDSELNEMERNGRCLVFCDRQGKIVSTWMYSQKNKNAYGYNLAADYPARGLGTFTLYTGLAGLYRDGFEKYFGWLRDNNLPTLNLHKHILRPSGKYYWQFVYKSGAVAD